MSASAATRCNNLSEGSQPGQSTVYESPQWYASQRLEGDVQAHHQTAELTLTRAAIAGIAPPVGSPALLDTYPQIQ